MFICYLMGVYYRLVLNNPVTHPINLHNSILVCIFVISTSRIVFSSFHIFHFCPYLGRGFLFGKYCVYLSCITTTAMVNKDIIAFRLGSAGGHCSV